MLRDNAAFRLGVTVVAALFVGAASAGAAWEGPVTLPAAATGFSSPAGPVKTLSCAVPGSGIVATDTEVLVAAQAASGPAIVPVSPATGAVGAVEPLPRPTSFSQLWVGALPGDRAVIGVVQDDVLRVAVRTRGAGLGPWQETPIPRDLGPGIRRLRLHQAADGTSLFVVSAVAPSTGRTDVGGHLAIVRRPDGSYSPPLVVPGSTVKVDVANGGHAIVADGWWGADTAKIEVSTLGADAWSTREVAMLTEPRAWAFEAGVSSSGDAAVAWTVARAGGGGAQEHAVSVARATQGGWTTDDDVLVAADVLLGPVTFAAGGRTSIGYSLPTYGESTRTERFGELSLTAGGGVRRDELPEVDTYSTFASWVSADLPYPAFSEGAGVRDSGGFLTATEPRPTSPGVPRAPVTCPTVSGSVLEVAAPTWGRVTQVTAAWRAAGAARYGQTQELESRIDARLGAVATGPTRAAVAWRAGTDLGLATAPDAGSFATTTVPGAAPADPSAAAVTRNGGAVVVVPSGVSGQPATLWRYTPASTTPTKPASPVAQLQRKLQQELQRQLRVAQTQWQRVLKRLWR